MHMLQEFPFNKCDPLIGIPGRFRSIDSLTDIEPAAFILASYDTL